MSFTKETTAVPLQHPDRFFIDGQWVKPSTSASFDVISPASETLYFRAAEAQPEDVKSAIHAARVAFDKGPWPRMSHAERAEYLHAFAAGMRDRVDDLSEVWTQQVGIIYGMTSTITASIPGMYDFYADLASDYPFVEHHQPTWGGNVGLIVREPVGVVGAIIPWNTPLALIVQKTAPALLAGCTIVLKSAPQTPGEGLILGEIAEAVGLPPGVLNCITADREASEVLVRDPDIDKIAFTGSTAVGRRIASLCGERIPRVTLELGGKSAAVLLDDYDLTTAAATLTEAATMMTGQVCSSLTRVIVSRKRHDDFVDALSESFSRVQTGDPYDPSTQMGPLAMERQRDRVEKYIAKGCDEGAKLAIGGTRPSDLDRGWFIEPTVFAKVDNQSTIAREEIFGPVLSVIAADTEDQAIDIANDTIYGLNSSVFTNDENRAYEVARQLRAGTVGHNAFRSDTGIAFGGFKQSGLGREGGREGLLPYLEVKTVILDAEPNALGS